ncbi:hypothetical protein JW964_23315 [candidate division KSB1 bacterium]|nr:hypothetical protein [candidate division KSB1 bacterium]
MKKNFIILLVLLFSLFLIYCTKEKIPETTTWIGLKIKQQNAVEKLIRTTGNGKEEIYWWAGGYMDENGSFGFELIDMKSKKSVIRKIYRYGDEKTGKKDNPRFDWWHAEQKDKITMYANRNYKMKIWGKNLAKPGAGWGMWLYRFGEKPQAKESPTR